jgi:ligand-binding SRPBCC domain-containing protein
MSLSFKSHSNIFTLNSKQKVPVSVEEAWEFFSSPDNLEKLTPSEMKFQVTSGKPEKAYPGQIISYKVSVVKGVRLNWVTEITQVKENHFFIDEQRFGPYVMWHHEHFFEPIDENSCWISDKVSYKLPLGILGKIAHAVFVKKQLTGIFEFRTKQINVLFK